MPGALAYDLGVAGFKLEAGVEHEHAGAAREEGLRAGDARRAGTDDAVHILIYRKTTDGQWKHSEEDGSIFNFLLAWWNAWNPCCLSATQPRSAKGNYSFKLAEALNPASIHKRSHFIE